MTSSHKSPDVSTACIVWPLGKLSPPPSTGSSGRGRSTMSLNTSFAPMMPSPTSTSSPARQPSRHAASTAPASIVTHTPVRLPGVETASMKASYAGAENPRSHEASALSQPKDGSWLAITASTASTDASRATVTARQ